MRTLVTVLGLSAILATDALAAPSGTSQPGWRETLNFAGCLAGAAVFLGGFAWVFGGSRRNLQQEDPYRQDAR